VGGTSHPGSSSAGSTGKDAGIDQPGTGGTGGEPDAGPDVPQSGTGGTGGKQDASVVGGSSSTGGAVAGNTGGSVTGGSTGGTSKSGGAGGSSSTLPDGGGDTADANPLLTGLVVYYRFETANGTVVQDSSGNGYDGTLSIGQPLDGGTAPSGTAYEYVGGKVGKALALHKAGLGYVRVPPAVFANATELTIALWVNVVTEQNWQRVLDVGITPNPYQAVNSPTGTKYFNIVPKAGGTTYGNNMLFSISSNGFSNEQPLPAPSIPVNTWTHVTVVLAAGGGARLYVNGSEAAFSAAVTLRPKDLGTIDYAFIGRSRFDADPSFEGLVDCFRIYNRALSAAEVQALFSYTVGH
jgi:hypothetical protein